MLVVRSALIALLIREIVPNPRKYQAAGATGTPTFLEPSPEMSDPVPPSSGSDDAIAVTAALVIPRAEVQFRATRAGGPGGQHVNTSSTRVELLWDLAGSGAVDEAQRGTIREKLAGRIDAEGKVRVVVSESRSQRQNREIAEERLAALLREALRPRKARRATRRPRRANEARLADKKKRGERKRDRRGDE